MPEFNYGEPMEQYAQRRLEEMAQQTSHIRVAWGCLKPHSQPAGGDFLLESGDLLLAE